MKTEINLKNFCYQSIRCIFLLFVSVIFGLCTIYFTYRANEANSIVEKPSNTLGYAIYLIVLSFLLYVIYCFVKKMTTQEKKIVSLALFVFFLIASLFLANSFNTMPSSDQIAMVFSTYDAVHGLPHALDIGGYINIYEQQTGLFSFLYLPVKFFQENWNYYYMLQAVMIQSSLYMIYLAIKKSYSDSVGLFTYFLFLMFIPVYFLEFIVYGEPYLFFVLALSLIVYAYKIKYVDYICVFLFGIGAMLRSNSVVLIIAYLILEIIEILHNHDWKKIIKCALCLVLYLIPARLNVVVVENAYNVEIGEHSMPFENWIAIGLGVSQMFEEPGMYDQIGYSYLVNSDYDKEYVKLMSKERIMESLEKMKDPEYRNWFFTRKMIITWTDPDYECMNFVFPNLRIPTLDFYGPDDNLISGQAPPETCPSNFLGETIYTLFHKIRTVERVYNSTVLALSILCAILVNKKDKFSTFLQLSFFGNAMLYLIIESKPRYVLIPFMLLILYVGCNYEKLINKLKEFIYHSKRYL